MRASFAVAALGLGLAVAGCSSHSASGHSHTEMHHPGPHHAMHHGPEGHRFDDPEAWAKRFESPERDAWQMPQRVLEALKLEPSMVVADIGSGTGYFAVRLAAAVPQGRVWAVDIEPSMVRYLNRRAREGGLDNLFSILGATDDPLLPEPAHRVIIVNTYHHIEGRVAYLQRVAAHLHPEGRLMIVDFEKGDLPVGPPDHMKLAPEVVAQEIAQAGLVVLEQPNVLPHQYVLVAGARTP